MTIDPRLVSVERWSAMTAASVLPYGSVPVLTHEPGWKNWARAVLAIPAIAALNLPPPDLFTHWRLWAFRLNEGLAMLGL